MRIWSILLIKSDLKWWIHLNRSLFLYILQYNMTISWNWFNRCCIQTRDAHFTRALGTRNICVFCDVRISFHRKSHDFTLPLLDFITELRIGSSLIFQLISKFEKVCQNEINITIRFCSFLTCFTVISEYKDQLFVNSRDTGTSHLNRVDWINGSLDFSIFVPSLTGNALSYATYIKKNNIDQELGHLPFLWTEDWMRMTKRECAGILMFTKDANIQTSRKGVACFENKQKIIKIQLTSNLHPIQ